MVRHSLTTPGSDVILRPLTHADAGQLAEFLDALSSESRRFSTFGGYDLAAARELCDAITRYQDAGIRLTETTDCR